MLKDIDDEDYQLITLPRLHRMYDRIPTSHHEADPDFDADLCGDDATDTREGATRAPTSSYRGGR